MRRGLLGLIGVLVLGLLAAWFGPGLLRRVEPPIRVGILHSRTGPLAISEAAMVDSEVMALNEIKQAGGLLGRDVEWVIANGESDPKTFGRQARRLIDEEHVSVIFGGMTSACREAIDEVVGLSNHLLIFPSNYEGLDFSQNVVCTGSLPNQQVIPAVNWCFETLKARKFFLAGSSDVMSYAIHTIVRDQLTALGASFVGEGFLEINGDGVPGMIAAIKASGADVVISSVVGDANKAFYHQMTQAGLTPDKLPVLSVTITEDDLRQLPVAEMVGDYAAWGYFQTIDRKENLDFVKAFQKLHGADRPTSDSIEAAYGGVKLWAQAVEEAGTADTTEVRKHLRRQSRNAPEGIVSIDYDTMHAWRPFYLGKIRRDGLFDIVWSLEKPIRPVPFPMFRTKAYWEAAVEKWNKTGRADGDDPPAPSPSPPSSPPRTSQASPVWGPRSVVRPAAPEPTRSAAVPSSSSTSSVHRARPTTR
ncbi:urea ABC transporter substrate-binding protein [Paludisphaera borealis]|uniref:Aliphatic amidase expression-regulating protein n=1 Tax=Paludisphaera borealis TaxID=1387353 RepID=A0A1U7CIS4_9BACT|nr:urea ABC transporter substrate-binding protein [Paludisphaera borealis]APW58808.1 Aliphatic amidase expression-regulating protein [Paludisphaera borealis]